MFKEFMMKKLVASKLGNLPKEQQEAVLAALEKDPAFFMKIGKEIEEKVKGGQDQMAAAMAVFQSHQDELKKLLS